MVWHNMSDGFLQSSSLNNRYRRFVLSLLVVPILLIGASGINANAKVATPPTKAEREQHYKKMVEEYSQAIAKNPHDAQSYYERGDAYQGLVKYQQCIADYTSCIKLDPNFAEAYAYRAQVYGLIHRDIDAIPDYTKLIVLRPKDAHPYLYRAMTYFDLGQYKKCVEDCTASLAIEKINSTYFQRADAYDKLGKHVLSKIDRQEAEALPTEGTITPGEQLPASAERSKQVKIYSNEPGVSTAP